MEKIICLLLGLLAAVSAQAAENPVPRRGLFVSVIQVPAVLSGRRQIAELVAFAREARVSTLFVQIYRANQAWFESDAADSEPYRACLKEVGEDPLRVLIREAHAAGIEVHAWMNLLSVGANEDAPILKKYGRDILTQDRSPKNSLRDYKIDNQYFLEPGDLRVQETLLTVVGEVVRGYPELDGIQFDYIRYPDFHPIYGYAPMNVERYQKATGRSAIEDQDSEWKRWKRDQVTGLLKRLARKARGLRPGIQVSTTGLVPYVRATEEAFQDWRLWIRGGLVDFVTLMGYTTTDEQFAKYVRDAQRQLGDLKKVNLAVGAYKLLKDPATFDRQYRACEDADGRSCAVFHYGSLIENPSLKDPLIRDGSGPAI